MVGAMAKRCLAAIALGLLSLAAASSASAAAAASSSSAEGGRRWAVIAVGSSGFRNYRHQADACHAYQLMVASGIPKAQIILMMQDDVAWASANPFPGELYNKPGWDSPNVYRDCHVDYRGSVVTADLFLKVITGDDSNLPSNGSGKVLRSSSSDQVFLNFVDHRGAGMVQFPNGPLLYAADLTQALETMQSKNMFKELVFYMEACHAGSMFQNLSKDGKIFAVAAANAHESSYATYCPPYDVAKGRHVGSCLGDLFSVAWMEDAERGVGRETVKDQVARATARTRSSHVSSFGDDSVQSLPMLGMRSSRPDGEPFRVQHVWAATAAAAEAEVEEAWDVRDIPLHTAYWQWSRASATDKIKQFSALEGIIAHRKADEELFANITREACHSAHIGCRDDMASLQMALQDVACHKALSTEVETECPRQKDGSSGWNGFSMKFSQVLVNICESRASLKKEIADLVLVVRSECRKEGQTQRGADAGSDDGARRLSPSPSLSLGTVLV